MKEMFPPRPMEFTPEEEFEHETQAIDVMDEEVSQELSDVLWLSEWEMASFVKHFPTLIDHLGKNPDPAIHELLSEMDDLEIAIYDARKEKQIQKWLDVLMDFFEDDRMTGLPEDLREEMEALTCLMIPGFNHFMDDAKKNTTISMISGVIDALPVVGIPKMIVDTLRGKDSLSENDLDLSDKGWNVVFVIVWLFGANALKWVSVAANLGRRLTRISAALRKATKLRTPSKWLYRVGKKISQNPGFIDTMAQTSLSIIESKWQEHKQDRTQKYNDQLQRVHALKKTSENIWEHI